MKINTVAISWVWLKSISTKDLEELKIGTAVSQNNSKKYTFGQMESRWKKVSVGENIQGGKNEEVTGTPDPALASSTCCCRFFCLAFVSEFS